MNDSVTYRGSDTVESSRERDPHLDNLRLVLIVLVVYGHLVAPISYHPAGGAVYRFVYLFHMPLFAFLCGQVSPVRYRPGMLADNFRRLILPLWLYQVAFAAALVALDPGREVALLTPFWILWFLLSLFCWRQALPAVLRLKYPLLAATAAGAASGYLPVDGFPLAWLQTLVFFPFFVAGAQLRGRRIAELRGGVRTAAAVAVIVVGLLGGLLCNDLDKHWLYATYTYADLGYVEWYAGIYRVLLYAVAAVIGWAVVVLTPARGGVLTQLGRRTMPVYLLHGFLVILARRLELFDRLSYISVFGQLAVWLVVSFAVVLLLSTRGVERWFWAPFRLPPQVPRLFSRLRLFAGMQ